MGPQSLGIPPMVAAMNPCSVMAKPMLTDAWVIGPAAKPPNPATATIWAAPADAARHQHDHEHGQRKREPGADPQGHTQHPAHHDHVALGEVEHARRTEDDVDAEPDEAVHAPRLDPPDHGIQK